MSQTESLTEYIKNRITDLAKQNDFKFELNKSLAATIESNKSLVEQAKDFSKTDAAILVKSENNFLISEGLRNSPHLQHLEIKFNPFLAEPLLREGSLLLDRCLQQRREYQELKTKWFEACVQIDELRRLNEITEKEEKENYETPSLIAQTELNAILSENEQTKQILSIIKEKYYKDFDVATGNMANSQANIANNTGQMDNYRYVANIQAGREKIPIEIQEAQQLGLAKLNIERENGAKLNIALKQSLAKFQRDRNNVARFVAARRIEQLLTPSGSLNFGEQMKPIWDRLQNDLAAAWFRLLAAAEGFQKLYDYPMDKCFDNSPKGSFNFDSLVTWCQNMNTWLASFLDTQQLVTRSFSLKQLLVEQGGDFNAGLSSGKWRFKLKEGHFSNAKLVRLRSFAIQIDSGHFSGNWNIAISPPTKAILRVNESTVKPLEQKVGTLYLGRINETTFQVMPESAAPPKLYNASPIGVDELSGEWGIEILGGMSTDEKPSSSINDIDIHLTVALV